jgi:hypothetical protein
MAKQKREIFVDKKVQARIDARAKGVDPDEEKPLGSDGWSAEAVKLAHLMCDPAYIGATQEDLAKGSGYSLRSVQRYMADPAFKKYAQEVAEKAFGDLFPMWVAGIAKGMKAGNSKFFEFYGKATARFKEVRQVTSDVTIADKREDDVESEIERLERELGGDVVN